jgi:hypothetical protein
MRLMTMALTADHAHIPKAIRHGLLALAVLGFAGMLLTSAFGFEEPNSLLLSASVAMLFAAPIAVLVHLICTQALTAEKKRVWWKAFGSADAWSAFSEYFSSADLVASTDRRALEAQSRRGVPTK